MIRVLIADDHAIIREGLKQILSEIPDIFVVGEAAEGSEVLALIERESFDIVTLDISMPGRSGLDILKEIKRLQPNLPVLMMSIHPEHHYAVRAIRSGAHGYMTKDRAPEELIDAIRTVAARRKYITPTLAEKLADEVEFERDKAPHESLSDREFTVLLLVAEGISVKNISAKLNLSPNTVHTYRERILKK